MRIGIRHSPATSGLLMDLDSQRQELRDALLAVPRGDAAALKTVYDRTSAKLFGVCLRILGDPNEAEDVIQDVYVTVWRNASRYDASRASPITWLVAIARNRSIDRIRGRHPERAAPLETAFHIADGAASAEQFLEASQDRSRLDGCLGELDAAQQQAIRTAFLDGVTYEALARQSGVPLGTMKSWIRRALIKLKACLQR